MSEPLPGGTGRGSPGVEDERLSDRETGESRQGEMEGKGGLAHRASDENERPGQRHIQAQEDHGEAEHLERRTRGGA